jgi:predicted type IV restriction endonuclease
MAKIPKKVIDRFIKSTGKFQKVLEIAKDRDVNESDTVAIIGDIFAEVFGYDKYLEITSEFAVRSTYCDLALKVADKVQFLIEAKAIGIDLKETHMKQAVDYGANHGVQWVVLTNGIEWQIYRIRFEQPINYDLVFSYDFLSLNPRDEKDQESLFILAKEALAKNAREDFYEKVQSVNRFMIGALILNDVLLNTIRRELRKLSEGIRIDTSDVEQIIRNEVLKRDLVEGEDAELAQARINRFYKKSTPRPKKKKQPEATAPKPSSEEISFSDQLLKQSDEESADKI